MKIHWSIGILPLLGLGLLPGQTSVQRGLVATQSNVPFLFPLMGHMRWTGNRLAGCDFCADRPIVWAVDSQGIRKAVTLDIPGADYIVVYDVAAGPDGSLTAVGLAVSGDSRMGSFIAWISADTTRQVVTRVWPYGPSAVAVAPDGTIWTVGQLSEPDPRKLLYPNVLRHYTPTGELLASTNVVGVYVPVGGVPNVSGTSAVMASNDRIGWLTGVCQYIEFSFEAVQLGTYARPNGCKKIQDVSGVALSSADDLLVGGKWLAPLAPLALDRATNTWVQVPVLQNLGNTQKILGFDGLTLVTLAMPSPGQSPPMRRYTWSGQPPAGGQ